MRKPPQPTLGKQYDGSTVSRTALNNVDDEEEDPFAADDIDSDEDRIPDQGPNTNGLKDGAEESGLDADDDVLDSDVPEDDDEEIDSDEAFGEDDVGKFDSFKFSGSRSGQSLPKSSSATLGNGDQTQLDEDNEDSEMDDIDHSALEEDEETDEGVEEDSDVSMGGDNESDDDSASTVSSSGEAPGEPAASSNRTALKAILANDTAAVASTLSAAAESDAKKGKAVKQQYQTFDRLLDARIKLQKGLTVVNDFKPETLTESDNALAILKAEEAALTLWSTIESIRHSFIDTQSISTEKTKKRKHPSKPTTSAPTSSLWARTESLETASLPLRRAVLDKWSSKARAATSVPTPRSQLVDRSSQSQNKITDVLDTYLASESDRLVTNITNTITPQPSYDDSTFYQSLLRDLIASRTATSNPTALNNSTSDLVLPSSSNGIHARNSKHKSRAVDTKASKGRKVRYTVHEKLQNFAAEEERGTWEESARREFFGSLFGNRRVLDEGENGVQEGERGGEDEDEGMVDREVEALRLFRS